MNYPLGPSISPLFAQPEKQVQPVQDDHFPTTVLQAVRPQLSEEVSPVQLDTSANISITPERTVLWNYSTIMPFRVGHVGTDGPPLMAVGAGIYDLRCSNGEVLEVYMFF